jgi:hypothetical protein
MSRQHHSPALSLFLTAGAALLLHGSPALGQGGGPPPEELCISKCNADVIVQAFGGWSAHVMSKENGNGTVECAPCAQCQAQVQYSYIGTGSWVAVFPDGSNSQGTGNTGGSPRLRTSCDSTDPASFQGFDNGGGSLTVMLLCPCVPQE